MFRLLFVLLLLIATQIGALAQKDGAYKFQFIERIETEQYGGNRNMDVAPDGTIYVSGETSRSDLPLLGPQIADVKTIQPSSPSGFSFLQKYDSHGTLLYSSYVHGCGATKIKVVDEENIYITGHFAHEDCATRGAFRVPASQGGAFLTKINLKAAKIVFSLSIAAK